MPTADLVAIASIAPKYRNVLTNRLHLTTCRDLVLARRQEISDAMRAARTRPLPSLEQIAVWQDEARLQMMTLLDPLTPWEDAASFIVCFRQRHLASGGWERQIEVARAEVESEQGAASPETQAVWDCRWVCARMRDQLAITCPESPPEPDHPRPTVAPRITGATGDRPDLNDAPDDVGTGEPTIHGKDPVKDPPAEPAQIRADALVVDLTDEAANDLAEEPVEDPVEGSGNAGASGDTGPSDETTSGSATGSTPAQVPPGSIEPSASQRRPNFAFREIVILNPRRGSTDLLALSVDSIVRCDADATIRVTLADDAPTHDTRLAIRARTGDRSARSTIHDELLASGVTTVPLSTLATGAHHLTLFAWSPTDAAAPARVRLPVLAVERP